MQVMPVPPGIDPDRIHTRTDLITQLDLLRRRAARGSGRATVSLDQLARRSRLPRSTVHSYVSGLRLPPPDALDAIVLALGADPIESAAWAEALERLTSERLQGIGTWTPLVPRQLPAAPAGFTGRSNELAALADAAKSSDDHNGAARIVAVAGPGGVGKTALVLRWAHDATELYPDGQVWVDLRGFSASSPLEPVDALEQLLRAVGVGTIDLPADVDTRAAMFRSAVAGRRLLVVLDNARDSAQVRPLLPGTPTATTVITSRNTLRSLAAREGAQRVWLGPLGADEARALLGEGFHTRASSGDDVLDRIAALCDGLPLALRIVRERLSPAPPDELARFAERLEGDRESLLAALDLDDGTGDSSVRGVLRWSYDALPADAAEAFRYIPLCLIPTFDVRCMAVLLDKDPSEARRLLDQLVAASLLDVADPDYYRIHDLVDAFAAECLAASDSDDDKATARIRLWREICVIGEAAIRLTDPGRPIRIPWPAHLEPLDVQGEGRDGLVAVEWITRHVDLVCASVVEASCRGPAEYSWLLAERGWRVLRWVADVGRFEEALEASYQVAIAHDAMTAAVIMSRLCGITYARRGNLDAAENAFTRAISLARISMSPAQVDIDRSNRAVVWSMRGELARAIQELAALTGSPGTPSERVPALTALVDFELQRGNVPAARSWMETLRLSSADKECGTALELEIDLTGVQIDLAERRYVDALAGSSAIEAAADESANREFMARAVTFKARAFAGRGDLEAAIATARHANELAGPRTARQVRIEAVLALADIEYRLERYDAAHARLEPTVLLARASGERYLECQVLLLMAKTLAGRAQSQAAAEAAQVASAIAEECGYAPLASELKALTGTLSSSPSRRGC